MGAGEGAGDRKWARRLERVALGVVVSMIGSGATCTRPAPTSDATPPTVRWTVSNDVRGGSMELLGDAMIEARAGDIFTVGLIVEDPEGVRRIELGGQSSWRCQGGVLQSESLGSRVQELAPSSDGSVLTQTAMLQKVHLSRLRCDPGDAFVGGSVVLEGEADNYFAGSTVGRLTIVRAGEVVEEPGEPARPAELDVLGPPGSLPDSWDYCQVEPILVECCWTNLWGDRECGYSPFPVQRVIFYQTSGQVAVRDRCEGDELIRVSCDGTTVPPEPAGPGRFCYFTFFWLDTYEDVECRLDESA